MRSRAVRLTASPFALGRAPVLQRHAARRLHISIAPSSATPSPSGAAAGQDGLSSIPSSSSASPPDARFEALGSHSSLLSVHLSASQPLYTRRGTLVGFGGDPSNAISTLAPLEPLRRLPFAVPWLYQRVTSTTPAGLLIGAKSPHTAFAVLDLDGRVDWKVVRRDALLAWTGHDLQVKPGVEARFGLAQLGNSTLTGRGLVALVGAGQIYRVQLAAGESYVAHPSNVLAYSLGRNEPQPFRFRSTSLRLQLPHLGRFLPNAKFFRDMRQTQAFRWSAAALFTLRTWARRSIWGDRLFMRFYGPSTVLLQSRNARLRDVITDRDVNEIADSPAGALQAAASGAGARSIPEVQLGPKSPPQATKLRYASIGTDGKVNFEQGGQR